MSDTITRSKEPAVRDAVEKLRSWSGTPNQRDEELFLINVPDPKVDVTVGAGIDVLVEKGRIESRYRDQAEELHAGVVKRRSGMARGEQLTVEQMAGLLQLYAEVDTI